MPFAVIGEGQLQRLDDLPHPPDWRFEAAYAIADDGTIAVIGTVQLRWDRFPVEAGTLVNAG